MSAVSPNVVILQQGVSQLENVFSIDITKIPEVTNNPDYDESIYIDELRTQSLPNDIIRNTEVEVDMAVNMIQMIRLLGAYCKTNSVDKVKEVIDNIHDTFSGKKISYMKNWIRLLTGIHPKIDKHLKNLEFWKRPYSEVTGTNSIMYYADTSSIDITFWTKSPVFTTNEIKWFAEPWPSPTYLRESVREKLDDEVVDLIMRAGNTTTKGMYRNLIPESHYTTASMTGAQERQQRPIDYKIAHGVSLNNDWYHQAHRMNGTFNKKFNKDWTIYHLDKKGYLVHAMINHLVPMKLDALAERRAINHTAPQGVEETFPRNTNVELRTDSTGNRILSNSNEVNNNVITPQQTEK